MPQTHRQKKNGSKKDRESHISCSSMGMSFVSETCVIKIAFLCIFVIFVIDAVVVVVIVVVRNGFNGFA